MNKIFKCFVFCFFAILIVGCNSEENSKDATHAEVSKKDKAVQNQNNVASRLDQLNDSINNFPENKDLLLRRALMYLVEYKDVDRSLRDVNKLLEVDPNFAPAYYALSDIYFDMGKMEKCKNALKKGKNLDPEDILIRLRLSEVFMLMGNFNAALVELKDCYNIDSDNPRIYYLMGYTCKLAGDTNSAMKAFKDAVYRQNDYAEAKLQIGILMLEKNDPAGMDFLNEAVRLLPNSPEVYFTRGLYHQKNKKFEEALLDYNLALEKDAGFVEALYNKSYLYLVESQDYDKAISGFSKVLDLRADYVEALYNRGRAYEAKGDYLKSYKDYKAALQLKPGYDLAEAGLVRVQI